MTDLRERILAARDLGEREVDVPEWGCAVRIRGLSAREAAAFEAMGEEWDERMAYVVACGAMDEAGGALFRPEDVEALRAKSIRALRPVSDAILVLSRLAADGAGN